jgi:hypothetical protein
LEQSLAGLNVTGLRHHCGGTPKTDVIAVNLIPDLSYRFVPVALRGANASAPRIRILASVEPIAIHDDGDMAVCARRGVVVGFETRYHEVSLSSKPPGLIDFDGNPMLVQEIDNGIGIAYVQLGKPDVLGHVPQKAIAVIFPDSELLSAGIEYFLGRSVDGTKFYVH